MDKINELKKSISNAEENKTVSIKKIKTTTLSRASTVDSRIPKHKTAKIQRHLIALKVVPFDTITKSDNQYKTINTSKYILLGDTLIFVIVRYNVVFEDEKHGYPEK